MLVGWCRDVSGPGEHTGVKLQVGGVQWVVGDRTERGGGSYDSWVAYAVTTTATTCTDGDGKRRRITPRLTFRATFYEDDVWSVEACRDGLEVWSISQASREEG